MSYVEKFRRHGVLGSARKAAMIAAKKSGLNDWRFRNIPKYKNPDPAELDQIEYDLRSIGVEVKDYSPSPQEFNEFQSQGYFSDDYHGGPNGGVWHEKLLEHWVAATQMDLMRFGKNDIYVDFAAASSPWAKTLREREGIQAYAIDIGEIPVAYQCLPYYRREDGTATGFEDGSVRGASLQCAFEMFSGQDDEKLIAELGRILAPGGKAIISPLYMHTHYCAYSSPEYFGKGYSDPNAVEYVRLDAIGIPSSRKYDAKSLKKRILDTITKEGMSYEIFALRNKEDLGTGIYCHFILEITRKS